MYGRNIQRDISRTSDLGSKILSVSSYFFSSSSSSSFQSLLLYKSYTNGDDMCPAELEVNPSEEYINVI